jgi:hypothetical protein
MKYRSRISVAMLLFVATVCFAPILLVGDNEREPAMFMIPFIALTVTVVLLVGIVYEIRDQHLAVKAFGFNFITLNIIEIRSVKRSYNPLSSPASSLKRILVNTSKLNVLISPVREKEFLAHLTTINPNIEIEVSDKNEWYRFWDWDI